MKEQRKIWQGVYQSFSEVECDQDVFGGSVWIDKVLKKARALMVATQSNGSITKAATTSDYALPFVAAMATKRGQTLRILDFGGGLGTSYIPLLSMLGDHEHLEFVVVENKTLCELGTEFFKADNKIAFCDSIPKTQPFHVVHAGSSLQYVDDWRGAIREFTDTGAKYLIFADLPAGDIETFVTAQWFHGRRLPVRFWNLKEFVSLVEGFCFDLIFKAKYRGYYLKKTSKLPTSHFDARHRLDDCCQLVFRRK